MAAAKGFLDIRPGVVKVGSPYSLTGRWVDSLHVRFVAGAAEKMGGWAHLISQPLLGICRSLHPHNSPDPTVAFPKHAIIAGTHHRLYRFTYDGEFDNITPWRTDTTLTGAVSTTSASPIVTIAHTAHGLEVGEVIEIMDSLAVGGLTLLGEYTVATVPNANSYTFDAGANATSTTGPAGDPEVRYYIKPGAVEPEDDDFGYPPRVWWLESYGSILLALPTNGTLYQYNADTMTKAEAVTNAPEGEAMFLTDERFPVILAADGVPMKMMWPDQDDITVWTATALNTANERTLKEGTRLMAGAVLGPRISLVWSDTATYLMQYTGDNNVYATNVLATNTGLIGPKAWAVNDGVAYWLSPHAFHMSTGGQVADIPNQQEILRWMMANSDASLNIKTTCYYSPIYNEVSWFLVRTGETEPDLMVTVNIDTFAWWTSTLARTAWMFDAYHQGTDVIAAGASGRLYRHETGQDAFDSLVLDSGVVGQGVLLDAAATVFEFVGDGETLAFDLGETITAIERVLWFEDGIPQRPGIDMEADGQEVNRAAAPAVDALIYGLLLASTPSVFSFTGDGATTNFDLEETITSAGRVLWFEDGIWQHPAVDFTISGEEVVRTTAPADDAVILVYLLDTAADVFDILGDGESFRFDLALGTIADAAEILWFIDGIYQHPNTNFDVSGVYLLPGSVEAIEAYVKSAPFDLDAGNNLVDVFGYVPDFEAIEGTLSIEIEAYDYPNETAALETVSEDFRQGQGIVDLHIAGRQVAATITSDRLGGHFRLGRQRVEIAASGRRR